MVQKLLTNFLQFTRKFPHGKFVKTAMSFVTLLPLLSFQYRYDKKDACELDLVAGASVSPPSPPSFDQTPVFVFPLLPPALSAHSLLVTGQRAEA